MGKWGSKPPKSQEKNWTLDNTHDCKRKDSHSSHDYCCAPLLHILCVRVKQTTNSHDRKPLKYLLEKHILQAASISHWQSMKLLPIATTMIQSG